MTTRAPAVLKKSSNTLLPPPCPEELVQGWAPFKSCYHCSWQTYTQLQQIKLKPLQILDLGTQTQLKNIGRPWTWNNNKQNYSTNNKQLNHNAEHTNNNTGPHHPGEDWPAWSNKIHCMIENLSASCLVVKSFLIYPSDGDTNWIIQLRVEMGTVMTSSL